MQKVIIVGYPKSGNTWLCRLTAELLQCPVRGFLYSDHYEIATEGLDKVSSFEVYKSHHQVHEISDEDQKMAKIISIIRDPRDISVSGRKYFDFHLDLFDRTPTPSDKLSLKVLSKLKVIINRSYLRLFSKKIKRKRMNKAILEGDPKVHHWCRISWKDHVTAYRLRPEILEVSYESLIDLPEIECRKILAFVGLDKSDTELKEAISRQSYTNTKERFISAENKSQANFMRKGEKEQWRRTMSKRENRKFTNALGTELTELQYPLL